MRLSLFNFRAFIFQTKSIIGPFNEIRSIGNPFKYLLVIVLLLGLLSGCAKEGKISLGEEVVSKTQGNHGQFSVETVAVNNNRIILQGKNLQSISNLKVVGPSLNRSLTIESISANQIVVFFSTLPSPQFVADLVYDLVISSASA